jgi:hypothetical protein
MMKKFGLLVLSLIAIVFAIQACAAVEYNVCDNYFFTAEYPTTWDFREKMTEFKFYEKEGDENRKYILITIYRDYPSISVRDDFDNMVNGSLDEGMVHILSTLKFKTHS